MFDPLYATDGETFRVARQINDGLVTFTPGTADLAPALAESWEQSADGLTWTFKLRRGRHVPRRHPVRRRRRSATTSTACTPRPAPATIQAEYWSDNMGGFKDEVDEAGAPVPSVYASCTAEGTDSAVIKLTRYTSKFPSILGLPSLLHPVADRAAAVRRQQRRRRG